MGCIGGEGRLCRRDGLRTPRVQAIEIGFLGLAALLTLRQDVGAENSSFGPDLHGRSARRVTMLQAGTSTTLVAGWSGFSELSLSQTDLGSGLFQ